MRRLTATLREQQAEAAKLDKTIARNLKELGYVAYSASGPDGFLPYHDFDRTGVVLSAIGANAGISWLALGKWSCIKNTIRFWATEADVSTEYLFQATLDRSTWPLRGSAQPFISQGDARAVRVLTPTNGLGRVYGDIVRKHHERTELNSLQSRTLVSLRDTLLPQLLSGSIRLSQGLLSEREFA